MRVLITGHNGYIGRVVADRLKGDQLDLHYVDRVLNSINPGVVADFEEISFKDYDVLVHLAADISVPESFNDPFKYYENNCSKLHAFLNNNLNKFKRVIFASSFAIYDEDFKDNPLSVYGSTKLEGEFIIKRWARETGGSYSLLRFANPVGVNHSLHQSIGSRMMKGYPNVMWKLASSLVNGSEFQIHRLDGMVRDFYPVEWIAETISSIIEGDDVGTVNLGSGKLTPVVPLLEHLCSKYGIKHSYVEPPPGTSAGPRTSPGVFISPKLRGKVADTYDPYAYCEDQLAGYADIIRTS